MIAKIMKTEFSEFNNPDIELQLATGFSDFPFDGVRKSIDLQSRFIDLKAWSPAGRGPGKLSPLCHLLREANPNQVRFQDRVLSFGLGLMDTTMCLTNITSREAEMVAFLISTNKNLTDLSLRFVSKLCRLCLSDLA